MDPKKPAGLESPAWERTQYAADMAASAMSQVPLLAPESSRSAPLGPSVGVDCSLPPFQRSQALTEELEEVWLPFQAADR